MLRTLEAGNKDTLHHYRKLLEVTGRIIERIKVSEGRKLDTVADHRRRRVQKPNRRHNLKNKKLKMARYA